MHRLSALIFCFAAAAFLAGCQVKKYHVDYDGHKGVWSNAEDAYAPGEQVTVWIEEIATDTDYTFYVDGESVRALYDERGYVVSFTMPEHDVKLTYTMTNSMEYRPPFDVLKTEDQIASFSDLTNMEEAQGTIYRVYDDGSSLWMETETPGISRQLYNVSWDLIEQMQKIIEDNDMASWNETYPPAEGQDSYMNVVLETDGGQIYADVLRMPENGRQVFAQLKELFETRAGNSWLVDEEIFAE